MLAFQHPALNCYNAHPKIYFYKEEFYNEIRMEWFQGWQLGEVRRCS